MKKIIRALFLFSVVSLSLTAAAFAAKGNTYELTELGLSLQIPADLVVFTRDIQANDSNLSTYGLTEEGLSELMLERNIYLNAWNETVSYEVVVTMTENPLENFNQCSDSTLTLLSSFVMQEGEAFGLTYLKNDIYQHSQVKFLRFFVSQPQPETGETAYGLQYYTVYDGKAINVTLYSYSRQIDSEKETLLAEIVDTIQFDTPAQPNDVPAPTEPFPYTDDDSGLSFTVPANWGETPMNEEREHLDAKFASNLESGLTILFSSEDIRGSLPESDRQQIFRSAVDNSFLSKADAAEMFNCTEEEISMITFSGQEYFCAECSVIETSSGLTFPIPVTHLLRCENGYMYMFQFFAGRDSPCYSDFAALMNSVVYPGYPSYPGLGDDPSPDLCFQSLIGSILLSLFVTIAVYTLPIVIYRYGIVYAPFSPKKAKRITIIYGLIALILMSIILALVNGPGARAGGAILLWSWVTYCILTGGGKKESSPLPPVEDSSQEPLPNMSQNPSPLPAQMDKETEPETEEPALEEPEASEQKTPEHVPVLFCHKCGNRLAPGSVFCNRCGTKVVGETS